MLSNKNANISNDVCRYYPYLLNEINKQQEEELESMLAILAILSFNKISKNYCRAIARVKTQKGENHLVFAASSENRYHAEENLSVLLYHLYKNDPAVFKDNKFLHIENMYVDIEPCYGRYSGHRCRDLFDNGRNVRTNDGIKKLAIRSAGKVYWNSPQVPVGMKNQIRTKDFEAEQLLLGFHSQKIYATIGLWTKCYMATGVDQQQYTEVDLTELFKYQIKLYERTDETKQVKQELLNKLENKTFPPELSQTTIDTIQALFNNKNEEVITLFCKAILENWNLTLLLKTINFKPGHIDAIREIIGLKDTLFSDEVQIAEDEQEEEIALVDIEDASQKAETDETKNMLVDSKLLPATDALSETLRVESEKLILQMHALFNRPDVTGLPQFFISIKDKPYELHVLFPDMRLSENGEEHPYIPLIDLLIKGKTQQLRLYLQTIKRLYKERKITKDDFCKIFTWDRNGYRLTPLHFALFRGNTDTLLIYMLELFKAVEEELLTPKEFCKVIFASTIWGVSTIHRIFLQGGTKGPAVAKIFFELLHKAIEKGWVDKKKYGLMLIESTRKGMTPLSYAIDMGFNNLALYFQELEWVVSDGCLADKHYKPYILENKYKTTPLYEALRSTRNKKGSAEVLLRHLERAVFAGWLSLQDYRKNLLLVTDQLNTTINAALFSGIPNNLQAILCAMQRAISRDWMSIDEYITALTQSSLEGYTPAQFALSRYNGSRIIYFEELDNCLVKGWLTQEKYCAYLLSQNPKVASALARAVSSGSLENLEWFLTKMRELFDKQWITKAEYIQAVAHFKDGFSALNNFVSQSNIDIQLFRYYISYLEALVSSKHLSGEAYTDLFMKHGFKIRSAFVFAGKDPDIYTECIAVIERGIQKGFIDASRYVEELTNNNTLLFFIIKQRIENTRLYLAALERAVKAKWLSPKQYEMVIKSVSQHRFSDRKLHCLYIESVKTLKTYCHYTENDYIAFHSEKCPKGFTAMHQICKANDVAILRAYIELIQWTCPTQHEQVIQTLFTTASDYGFYPDCDPKAYGFKECKDYLDNLKKQYRKARMGKRALLDEPQEEQRPTKKIKLTEQQATLFRQQPLPHAPKDLNMLPLQDNPHQLKEFIMITKKEAYQLKVDQLLDDNNDYYRTYSCSDPNQKRFYVVQLKKCKPNNEYNFQNFMPGKVNAGFIVTFVCPLGGKLFLPPHLSSIVPVANKAAGQIIGKPEFAESMILSISNRMGSP